MVSASSPRWARSQILVTALCLLLGIFVGEVPGQFYNWLGGGLTDNWGDPSNWSAASPPPPFAILGEPIYVFMQGPGGTSDLADQFNVDADWQIDSLTFNSQATGSISLTGGELVLWTTSDPNFIPFIRNSDVSTHSFNNSRVFLAGPSSPINEAILDADTGDLDFNAIVDIGASTDNDFKLTVMGGNDVYFDGGIGAIGNLTTATLVITENTTAHIGKTSSVLTQIDLISGTLQINSNSNLGNGVNIATSAGATFNVNGFVENIDQITGSGNISLGSGSLTLGDTANFTFSGVISGNGSITKDRGGTLTLAGVSTYSGATNITAGTLRLNNSTIDGSLSSSTDVNVSAGATFDLNGVTDTVDSITGTGTILLGGAELQIDESSGMRTFSGSISGSGTLRKNGGHTLVLSGNNSFTSLIIGGGELSVGSSSNLGASTSTVLLSSILDVTDSFTNPRTVLLSNGTFDINSGASLTQSGTIQNNTTAASLTKNGSGTLILTGSNTYTGDSVLQAGRLEISGGSERISDSSDLVVNGGTFDLNNFTETVGGLSGSGGSIDTGGASGRLIVNQAESLTYSGVISGSGGLTKQGSGSLSLAGQHTYDGSTLIQRGTLRLVSGGGLDNTTDVDVSSGATFDMNGISDTVDSIAGAGSILLGSASLVVDQVGGSTTFSGVISGTGHLSKSGTHTLVLSGSNTFSGGISIFDGAVSVGADNHLGAAAGAITLALSGKLATTGTFSTARTVQFGMSATGTIETAAGTTLTHTGALSGSSGVTFRKTGAGTYTLGAANAMFGGNIAVDAGTFEIGIFSGDALSTSTRITVASGATLLNNQVEGWGSLDGAGAVVANATTEVGFDNSSTTFFGTISGNVGGGYVGKAGTGVWTWTNPHTYQGQTRINAGTLRLSGSGSLPDTSDVLVTGTWDLNSVSDTVDALTGSGSVLLGSAALTVGSSNGTGTFSGVISGAGSASNGALVKIGSGTQTLSGNNTYTNRTEVNGGTLQIASSANLGNGSVRIGNGARLQVTGTTTYSRTIDLTAGGGVIGVSSGQTLTQAAAITGSGSGLTKADAGILVLTATNTYTGGTDIAGGILRQQGPSAMLPDVTDVNVSPGATWELNGVSDVVDSYSGGGSISLGGGTLIVQENGGTRVHTGALSGSGGLVKRGSHILQLSGVNTFSGPIAIEGGKLSVTHSSNLGSSTNDLTLDGGTLSVTSPMTFHRDIMLGSDNGTIEVTGNFLSMGSGLIGGVGQLMKTGSGNLSLASGNTYFGGTLVADGSVEIIDNSGLGANFGDLTLANGTLLVTADLANLHQIIVSGAGTVDVDGSVLTQSASVTGTGTLVKSGDGVFLLTVPATHSGDTIVSDGSLRFGSGALPDLFDVTVDPAGVWDLNGVSDTVDGLFGSGTVSVGSGTLTLGSNNGGGIFSGRIIGAGGLVKVGSGVQTVSGQNTYFGDTVVDGGELILNGGGRIDQSAMVVGFNIGSDGIATMEGPGTTWDLSGNLVVGLDGTARMNIRDGAVMTVEGDVRIGSHNQGTASAGTLSLAGGTLDTSKGSGIDVINGTLQGHGLIVGNIDNFDRLTPGNSAGILQVTGNVVESSLATLAIEVGGRDNSDLQNPQFDVLNVTGNLDLDGFLEVSLIGGFTPLPGDTFTVGSAASLVGSFANVVSGARVNLTGGETGSFRVNYGAGSPFGANLLVLSDFQAVSGLLGDFDGNGLYECADVDSLVVVIAAGTNVLGFDMNGDGMVNGTDLTQWLAVAGAANLASGNPYIAGDGNLDGSVDGSDFNIWNSSKFTATAAWCSGDYNADGAIDGSDFNVWNSNKFTSADGTSQIPEPNGLMLALFGLFFTVFSRRRHGRDLR